jgi:signal transduction histidine kinase
MKSKKVKSGILWVRSLFVVGLSVFAALAISVVVVGIGLAKKENQRSLDIKKDSLMDQYYSYFLGDLLSNNFKVVLNRIRLLETAERELGVQIFVKHQESNQWISSSGIGIEAPLVENETAKREIISGDRAIGELVVVANSQESVWRTTMTLYLLFLAVVFALLWFLFIFGIRYINALYFRPLYELQIATLKLNHYLFDKGSPNPLQECGDSRLSEINVLKKNMIRISESLKAGIENEKALVSEISQRAAFQRVAEQVVHDIRSPLAALKFMKNELMKGEKLDENLYDEIIKRVKDIAGHLLEKSKQGDQELNLLKEVIVLCKEKQVEVNGKYGDSVYLINTKISESIGANFEAELDWPKFKRCLSNLVNNSCEAMHRSGEVSGEVNIGLSYMDQNRKQLLVTVHDTGPGFSVSQITEFQANGGYLKSYNNTGLGLSSCVDWIKSVGGEIIIQTEDTGANVRLVIPLSTNKTKNEKVIL